MAHVSCLQYALDPRVSRYYVLGIFPREFNYEPKDAGASRYINHPIALANVLCNEGGITDPMILAAALLHDALEDTGTNYEELRGQFRGDIADKICNLRDLLGSPPAGWSVQRKQKYFDWAKQVVDGVRGAYPALEQRFDALYRQRPAG